MTDANQLYLQARDVCLPNIRRAYEYIKDYARGLSPIPISEIDASISEQSAYVFLNNTADARDVFLDAYRNEYKAAVYGADGMKLVLTGMFSAVLEQRFNAMRTICRVNRATSVYDILLQPTPMYLDRLVENNLVDATTVETRMGSQSLIQRRSFDIQQFFTEAAYDSRADPDTFLRGMADLLPSISRCPAILDPFASMELPDDIPESLERLTAADQPLVLSPYNASLFGTEDDVPTDIDTSSSSSDDEGGRPPRRNTKQTKAKERKKKAKTSAGTRKRKMTQQQEPSAGELDLSPPTPDQEMAEEYENPPSTQRRTMENPGRPVINRPVSINEEPYDLPYEYEDVPPPVSAIERAAVLLSDALKLLRPSDSSVSSAARFNGARASAKMSGRERALTDALNGVLSQQPIANTNIKIVRQKSKTKQ